MLGAFFHNEAAQQVWYSEEEHAGLQPLLQLEFLSGHLVYFVHDAAEVCISDIISIAQL